MSYLIRPARRSDAESCARAYAPYTAMLITELSIYLDRSATGAGVGPALYSALLELLRLQNYVNVYGAVSIPNPPSERLHEKLGFERVAVFRRAGRKLGEWRDLAFYHIVLNDYAASPAEVIPFPALAPEAVLRACAEGAARLNR